MLRSVFAKTLRDLRRGFGWWTLGLAGYVALIVAVWPTVKHNPALIKLHETYPEALRAFVSFGGELDFGTPAGYLGAEIFSLIAPLLLVVAGIGAGARAIAGEEERGTLDLLLSMPVSRRRLVLEKLGALVVEVTGLGAVLWAALAIGSWAAGMHLSAGNLAAAAGGAVLLALAFGCIALLLGAATGRRGLATGLTAALAVAAYLLNSLAPLVHALEHVRKASPFYHYAAGDPLRQGFAVGHGLVLVAIAVAAGLLAPVLFDRRDLSV